MNGKNGLESGVTEAMAAPARAQNAGVGEAGAGPSLRQTISGNPAPAQEEGKSSAGQSQTDFDTWFKFKGNDYDLLNSCPRGFWDAAVTLVTAGVSEAVCAARGRGEPVPGLVPVAAGGGFRGTCGDHVGYLPPRFDGAVGGFRHSGGSQADRARAAQHRARRALGRPVARPPGSRRGEAGAPLQPCDPRAGGLPRRGSRGCQRRSRIGSLGDAKSTIWPAE